jgi:CHAT domain-containing protein/tetratricopeptide (TPR) repeat protein
VIGLRHYRFRGIAVDTRAAAAVVLALAAITLVSSRRTPSSAAKPAPVFGSDTRPIEPRVSGGFAWAPFRAVMRTEGVFEAAVASKEPAARGELIPFARHTAGVAYLLAGRSREALTSLTAAAETLNDAAAWNDLSAAYHEVALRYNAPQLLADAVTSADRALALEPRLPEALFNRALMLERLGLRTDARNAWLRYLEVDATGEWAHEARTHLIAVPAERPFLEILDEEYDHVINDPAAAEALFARDRFGARGMGIMQVLGRWGEAVLRGDERDAERHLTVARRLGVVVARDGGDQMLKQSVAAIDGSTGETRSLLAAAHADYRAGLIAFQDSRPAAAEPLLRRAVSRSERAGAPIALPARYFAANTVYEQGQHDAAERQIEQLLARTPEDFPAYRAFMMWQLGMCHRARADWGPAITFFEQSAAIFERLGETQNVAAVQRLLAFVYDRVGDRETAWRHRVAALRDGLGGASRLVQDKTAESIAEAAILHEDWHTAASFLALHIDLARRTDDDVQLADSLFLRAVVRDRLHDASGASDDVLAAKAAAGRIQDEAYRASLHVTELRATAMLSATPPALADALLTEAIASRSRQSDPLSLSGLLLQRARARRQDGNAAGAMRDVELGIAELERNRESLPEGEVRWGSFYAAEELFDEGIELELESGDAAAAFRFAEMGRARSLLESYGRSPAPDCRRLPPSTVVVEYAALRSQLVIFTADVSGVHAWTVKQPREVVKREVDAATRAFRGSSSVDAKTAASALYRRLIEPVEAQLAGTRTAVFVPDGVTAMVAFGALMDSGGMFLLQRHAIVIAPSTAVYTAAAERRRKASVPRNALLISAADASAETEALRFVEAEAQQIARLYRNSVRIQEDQAQFEELRQRASDADVIHFGGHAIGDERGFEPACIVLRQDRRERRVGVAEIARLRLMRTSTVVLAGCSTARGERRAAEGVISVAHGFLSAGAPSVIATLWPIDDDATARFFPRLHRRLAEGMPPAEALRAAQLESIQRGDIPMSLWAAVQDIGS